MIKTHLIIGAGPAGLAAASALSQDSRSRVLVVDTGRSLSMREHEKASDLGCGIGGAGLFSDGKFSYYPSGTNLYTLSHNSTLRNSYSWVTTLLNRVGITTYPYPDNLSRQVDTGFGVKDYNTAYGSLSQRYDLIEALSILQNTEFVLQSKVTQVRKKIGGKYAVTITKLSDQSQHVVLADSIILATGRLGPLEFKSIFGEIGALSQNLRYEFGLRVESKADLGFLTRFNKPDVKAIWQVPFGEIRTFCACRNGEIWNIPYAPLSAVSGRSDGPRSEYSNFGLLARFKGNHFDRGGDIFAKAMRSLVIKQRQVVWQSLPSFMGKSDLLSGDITQSSRPWFPQRDFKNASIAELIGDEFQRVFVSVLSKLIDWSPDLYDASTAVMFPAIEGVGSYVKLTDGLQIPNENIWCAGDMSGIVRGIIPALISGHYAGKRVMQDCQSVTNSTVTGVKLG